MDFQNHRADAGVDLCDPHRTGASDAGGDQSKLSETVMEHITEDLCWKRI